MINETKNLLEHIQKDVTVYMDKLERIEDQIAVTAMKTKEEKIPLEKEETDESYVDEPSYDDIESEVDELLSKLKNKERNQ